MPVVDHANGAGTVSMIAGIRLCAHHADHLGPYDVIKREEVEAYVKRVCRTKNMNFPNFDMARLLKVPFVPTVRN